MTEQEAFAIIRNVIRLEGVARRIAIESSKELREAFKFIRDLIANLPEGSVERELAYKQLIDLIQATMDRPVETLRAETQAGLQAEAPEQVEWAQRYVDVDAGINNDIQRAALAGVEQAKVAGKPLDTIFKGLNLSQFKEIDKIVREGFLTGMTNDQIAKAIVGRGRKIQSQHRAIARTAVMSMAQQAHNQFWDANDDVIEGWVWDASMDYRVCPVCAPLDGERKAKRSDLPEAPIHPNCRCMVLPITGIDTDTGGRSYVELVKNKPVEGPGVRVYKQKVRGSDGKMYWKVARDTKEPITMAGFLRRANNITQEEVLGKDRARRFRALIKGTPGSRAPLSPEEALVKVTK